MGNEEMTDGILNNFFMGMVMASVRNEDIKEIFAFMGDFWKLLKAYWIIEDNAEYWAQVHGAIHELSNKYPGDFVKCMLVGFWTYLDKECGKRNGQERNERYDLDGCDSGQI